MKQAEGLDKLLDKRNQSLNAVVEFKIDDKLLVSRITGRLIHKVYTNVSTLKKHQFSI